MSDDRTFPSRVTTEEVPVPRSQRKLTLRVSGARAGDAVRPVRGLRVLTAPEPKPVVSRIAVPLTRDDYASAEDYE